MVDQTSANGFSARLLRGAEGWLLPAAVSALLHGVAVLMLWGGGWQQPEIDAPAARVQTQLVMLSYEVAVAEPEPPPAPFPMMEPPVAESPAAVAPEPAVDQGLIARQRLEQEERERDAQRQEAKRKERQEEERREEERQRLEQELAQQQEQQRIQEEQQRARDEQQRLAAARAQAEADAKAAAMAQYQPVHKAPPAYPRRALDSRIEGDCTVVYTVTPEGRVSKPSVVEEACDDPIFIRPSLQAASAFRYQPRIVNGRAVAVHDVRNTFRYRIQ